MKKTLLSVLAGIAVVGSASALPSLEDRKALCLKHPDKYVWVEKTEACVPVNPCKSDDINIKSAYCNQSFSMVQLGDWRQGVEVVKAYAEHVLGVEVTTTNKQMRKDADVSFFEQDYLPCKLSDGGYMVFEFDDLSDIAGGDKYRGAIESACRIYGGKYELQGPATFDNNKQTACFNLDSESDCKAVADLSIKILNNDVLFTNRWYERPKNCYIEYEK